MKKIRVMLAVLFAAVMCASIAQASGYSLAAVYKGITGEVTGGVQTLSATTLLGNIESASSSTGQSYQTLRGDLYSKGAIWTHRRDSKEVAPGASDVLYWGNPNGDTGTFWPVAQAPYGNHNGTVEAWQ